MSDESSELDITPFVYSFIWKKKVLAEEGKAKAIAFDEIDKAPEEKARGITIATVFFSLPHTQLCLKKKRNTLFVDGTEDLCPFVLNYTVIPDMS